MIHPIFSNDFPFLSSMLNNSLDKFHMKLIGNGTRNRWESLIPIKRSIKMEIE